MFESFSRRALIPVCLTLLMALLTIGGTAFAQQENAAKVKILASQPIGFEPNRGQAENGTKFVGRTPNMVISFRKSELEIRAGQSTKASGGLRLQFVGGDEDAQLSTLDPQTGYSNYILGNNASRWIDHVPQFGKVQYSGIYPGIDVVFYGNNERLEHDFIVGANADYHAIQIRVEGAHGLSLQADGSLKIAVGESDFVFAKPEIYQLLRGGKKLVKGRFVRRGECEFGFEVGKYN